MKKSTRILSILMAIMMLLGTFSVMGSAYKAYRGNNVVFDDIDSATFTTGQYASMGLDEVDRMLAEEQIVVDLVGIVTLDLTSLDHAIASIEETWDAISALSSAAGDASKLDISSLAGKRRNLSSNGDEDLEIIYSVFDFLGNNAQIFEAYVAGTISLGALQGFVRDYIFNIRELLIGLLFGATEAGKAMEYDYFDHKADPIPAEYLDNEFGILNILQGLLNDVVLGKWEKLDEYFDDPYDDHYEVQPGFYAFKDAAGNNVSDEAINTAQYDYYGWVHPKNWVTVGLGGAKRVANGAAAPAADFELIKLRGDVKVYEFIENLLQQAFNYVLVPVLNRDTAPWLKKECGYTFPENKCKAKFFNEATGEWENNPEYVENFPGIAPENPELSPLYNLFETENLHINKVVIPEGETLIENFNVILGEFIDQICKYDRNEAYPGTNYSWSWTNGSNDLLFGNICNVARFVVLVTGDTFFSEFVEVKPASEVEQYDDQGIVAYILRSIINGSVSWMFIDDTYQTVPDVLFAAVQQLLAQDLPEVEYVKPVYDEHIGTDVYFRELVDKILVMLMDLAAYKLNQVIDANLGDGLVPIRGDSRDYMANVIMIAEWAVKTYGRILRIDGGLSLSSSGTHNADDVWSDLDKIVNSIIPLNGAESVINDNIAVVEPRVLKSIVLDCIVYPVINLNSTNFAKIFVRNTSGFLATSNGIQAILRVVKNVFEILLPGVFPSHVGTLDAFVQNGTLSKAVYDIMTELGRNGEGKPSKSNGNKTLVSRTFDLVYVALPIVCQVLGLSSAQKFGELENYMPGTLSGSATTFAIYNGSSGINTGIKGGTIDQPYRYEILSISVKGYKGTAVSNIPFQVEGNKMSIPSGESANVTISNYESGSVIEFTVQYNVKDENGNNMTSEPLFSTKYAYVGAVSKDDDDIEKTIDIADGRKIRYKSEIYVPTGGNLASKLSSYSIVLEDNKANDGAETPVDFGNVTVTGVSNSSSAHPFAKINTAAVDISAHIEGLGGQYPLYPFEIAQKADGSDYQRYGEAFLKNDDGSFILDEEGNKVPDPNGNGGVPVGKYTITTSITVSGTPVTVQTNVHIYDDYGLDRAFKNAVDTNRQISNYDTEKDNGVAASLFNDYVLAIKNAATVSLRPKNGATFESDIAYTGSEGYANLYEAYAAELDEAILALKNYEKSSGTSELEAVLRQYSGINYDIVNIDGYDFKIEREYDDPQYKYFGIIDFEAYTYNRYKTARNRAENLIDSQYYFIDSDFVELGENGQYAIRTDLTDEEKAELAAQKKEADEYEKPAVGAVAAQYAKHMVELMGARTIRKSAVKGWLQFAINYAQANFDPTKAYIPRTIERYTKAINFANAVMADNSATLERSKVKQATNELLRATKKLAVGADYSALNMLLANSELQAAITMGVDKENNAHFTPETFNPFYDAYVNAMKLIDEVLSDSASNQRKIDAAVIELSTTFNNLTEASAGGSDVDVSINPDIEFYLENTYAQAYYPIINNEMFELEFSLPDIDGDGKADANNLIYGVGDYLSEDDIADIFTVQGGTIEIATLPGAEGYGGTGTVVSILDGNGNIYDSYMVILRGDTNGSASIDFDDSSEVSWYFNAMDNFYEYDPETCYKYYGGDTNGDFMVDSDDIANIKKYASAYIEIAQDTGDIIEL